MKMRVALVSLVVCAVAACGGTGGEEKIVAKTQPTDTTTLDLTDGCDLMRSMAYDQGVHPTEYVPEGGCEPTKAELCGMAQRAFGPSDSTTLFRCEGVDLP